MSHIESEIFPIAGVSKTSFRSATEAIFSSPHSFESLTEKFSPLDINLPENDVIILAQHIIYLYIKIFHSLADSKQISKYLVTHQDWIEDLIEEKKIVDLYLRNFLTNGYSDVNGLMVVAIRLDVTSILDASILHTVCAAYGDNRHYENVTIHSIKLTSNPQMPILLSPEFITNIDPNLNVALPDNAGENYRPTFWKLVRSMTVFNSHNKSMYEKLYMLATLAVPLNPTILNVNIAKRGDCPSNDIPLTNFLAMAIREYIAFGHITEQDRHTSDVGYSVPRHIVYKTNAFFGSHSFLLEDFKISKEFVELLYKSSSEGSRGNDRFITYIMKYFGIPVAEKEAPSLETAKDNIEADDSVSKLASRIGIIEDTSEIEEDPDKDITNNADFDKETEASQDNSIASQDTIENSPSPVDAIIPLANTEETINDHLYRLAVLEYTVNLIKNPSSDVSPDTIDTLRLWCNRWLFLAAAETTRNLLTQLKISSLKEFKLS